MKGVSQAPSQNSWSLFQLWPVHWLNPCPTLCVSRSSSFLCQNLPVTIISHVGKELKKTEEPQIWFSRPNILMLKAAVTCCHRIHGECYNLSSSMFGRQKLHLTTTKLLQEDISDILPLHWTISLGAVLWNPGKTLSWRNHPCLRASSLLVWKHKCCLQKWPHFHWRSSRSQHLRKG